MRIESEIQHKCNSMLTKNGFMYMKTTDMNRRGIPDAIVIPPIGCHSGPFFIEYKKPNIVPTGLQRQTAIDLMNRGCLYFIIDSAASFEILLKMMLISDDAVKQSMKIDVNPEKFWGKTDFVWVIKDLKSKIFDMCEKHDNKY